MFFEFTPPDEGIMTCFGYEDVYQFLADLRDDKLKAEIVPDSIVLVIDNVSYLISTADWDAPAVKAGMKRLWAKAPDERVWCKCKRLTWRGTHRHLHVEF